MDNKLGKRQKQILEILAYATETYFKRVSVVYLLCILNFTQQNKIESEIYEERIHKDSIKYLRRMNKDIDSSLRPLVNKGFIETKGSGFTVFKVSEAGLKEARKYIKTEWKSRDECIEDQKRIYEMIKLVNLALHFTRNKLNCKKHIQTPLKIKEKMESPKKTLLLDHIEHLLEDLKKS